MIKYFVVLTGLWDRYLSPLLAPIRTLQPGCSTSAQVLPFKVLPNNSGTLSSSRPRLFLSQSVPVHSTGSLFCLIYSASDCTQVYKVWEIGRDFMPFYQARLLAPCVRSQRAITTKINNSSPGIILSSIVRFSTVDSPDASGERMFSVCLTFSFSQVPRWKRAIIM